jgi:hypothetical protein
MKRNDLAGTAKTNPKQTQSNPIYGEQAQRVESTCSERSRTIYGEQVPINRDASNHQTQPVVSEVELFMVSKHSAARTELVEVSNHQTQSCPP